MNKWTIILMGITIVGLIIYELRKRKNGILRSEYEQKGRNWE